MASWHNDTALKGRFHPDYPDDMQVLIHEGSHRFTKTKPELMWVKITEHREFTCVDGSAIIAYKATLLNQPQNLSTIAIGHEILFVAHEDFRYAIRVTDDYLADRVKYTITPCSKCGLPELFDPVVKLYAKSFPGLADRTNSVIANFTSYCPLCGGVIVVSNRELPPD